MSAWPQHALAAASHPDPYPYYRDLARRGWCYDAERRMWLAASSDAAQAVLSSPACRVRPPEAPVPPALADSGLGEVFGRWLRMCEAPAHPSLRAAVQASLTGLPLNGVRDRAFSLAGRYQAGRPVDGAALDGLTAYLPVATLAALLGWPGGQLQALAARIGMLARALAADAGGDALRNGEAACADVLDGLRALPAPDGSWLRQWRRQFAELDEAALQANLLGVLFQSLDATAGLLSAGIAWRCQERWDWRDDAQWRRRLQRDPVLHNTRRFVEADVALAGQELRAGDQVLVLLAAAAQDPAGPGEAMDFGCGRHACPGEALALAIARGALDALEESRPDWRSLGGGITFRSLPNVRVRRFGAGERT
ncbi:cytochrome P450 [Chromobacterium sphagni]|uniref:Cytochrome n=1 Tax=Chromobacterium sphagni TaxID=1903179 RepID=A0ABX3CHN5_9NEIS|nr:cytochrome P450 [Chromobacterium sphagni]OHX21555.1 hypothetical protein BI344_03280 [Chromobacterium sphagni]